jgi:hypothetical protein
MKFIFVNSGLFLALGLSIHAAARTHGTLDPADSGIGVVPLEYRDDFVGSDNSIIIALTPELIW